MYRGDTKHQMREAAKEEWEGIIWYSTPKRASVVPLTSSLILPMDGGSQGRDAHLKALQRGHADVAVRGSSGTGRMLSGCLSPNSKDEAGKRSQWDWREKVTMKCDEKGQKFYLGTWSITVVGGGALRFDNILLHSVAIWLWTSVLCQKLFCRITDHRFIWCHPVCLYSAWQKIKIQQSW